MYLHCKNRIFKKHRMYWKRLKKAFVKNDVMFRILFFCIVKSSSCFVLISWRRSGASWKSWIAWTGWSSVTLVWNLATWHTRGSPHEYNIFGRIVVIFVGIISAFGRCSGHSTKTIIIVIQVYAFIFHVFFGKIFGR